MNENKNPISVWKTKMDKYYQSASKEKLKADLQKAGFTIKDNNKNSTKGKGANH